MLGTLTPLGERARGSRWWTTVTAYMLGAVFAGGTVGALLGLGGHGLLRLAGLPAAALTVLLGLGMALGVAVDSGFVPVALPTTRRQVNDLWLYRYRGWVYGSGFGLQLGLGVATLVRTSGTYAAFAAALLSGSWLWGAGIGGTLGLVRSGPVLAVAGVRRPGDLGKVHRWLTRLERPVMRAGSVARAALALILLLTLGR